MAPFILWRSLSWISLPFWVTGLPHMVLGNDRDAWLAATSLGFVALKLVTNPHEAHDIFPGLEMAHLVGYGIATFMLHTFGVRFQSINTGLLQWGALGLLFWRLLARQSALPLEVFMWAVGWAVMLRWTGVPLDTVVDASWTYLYVFFWQRIVLIGMVMAWFTFVGGGKTHMFLFIWRSLVCALALWAREEVSVGQGLVLGILFANPQLTHESHVVLGMLGCARAWASWREWRQQGQEPTSPRKPWSARQIAAGFACTWSLAYAFRSATQ